MEQQIAEMNLERFRKRLEKETDQMTRATLRRLVTEEEKKLQELRKKERPRATVRLRAAIFGSDSAGAIASGGTARGCLIERKAHWRYQQKIGWQ